MSYILKKGNFKKPEDRRWLYECGHCHSDFLVESADMFPVRKVPTTTDDSAYTGAGTVSYYYLICPVCGKASGHLDYDWITEGYIREAKLVEPAYANKVTVSDYDGVEYTYSLGSEDEVYKLAEYIPDFKFPVKKVPYDEWARSKKE